MEAKRPGLRAAAVCIVAAILCCGVHGTASETEGNTTRPPYHPYLAPGQPLTEMEVGDPVEREMARSARVLFPTVAQGSLPATDFGTIMLPSFSSPHALLFQETDGRTLVEKREIEFEFRLDDLTPGETFGLVTASRPIPDDVAMASTSVIRRALRNVRPHLNRTVMDGESYYFFSQDGSGRAHSPGPDTEAGKLVRLVWALGNFVDGQLEERELRVTVENALRAKHGPQGADDG